MAIPLTIGSTTFNYPQKGDVGYADDATGWAQAVTAALAGGGGGGITQLTGDVVAGPGAGTQSAQVIATHLSSPLPVAQGGTGAASTSGALSNILPSQTGQNGKVLGTNGSVASWVAVPPDPVTIPHGGTGQTTRADAIAALLPDQTAHVGDFLTAAGAGLDPVWTTVNLSSSSDFWFGSGEDGDVTVSAPLSLSRDMYYNNLTLAAGAAISPNGFKIFVNGILDISAAPAGAITGIGALGSNGSASTGGNGGAAVSAAGSIGGGTNGGTTGSNGAVGVGNSSVSGAFTNPSNGGSPSKGGAGGDGASAGGANTASPPARNTWPVGYLTDRILKTTGGGATASNINSGGGGAGGAGGGGDSAANAGGGGGGGGAGGYRLWIAARTIARGSNSTAGIITVIGGAGGNGANNATANCGGGGGGAGGGGGELYLVFKNRTGSAIVNGIELSGGIGGNGGNGGSGAKGGGGGGSGGSGIAYLFDLLAGTTTYTATVTGTDGDATPSGTTSGLPGKTNVKRINL